jgi:predicted DNA-binding ArsR family transcriptional regulator
VAGVVYGSRVVIIYMSSTQFKTNNQCCFNDIIGLPVKNGKEYELYDYEQEVIQKLEEHRYLRILKATSLGLSELLLRYIAWRALVNDDWKNSQAVIVTALTGILAHSF